MFLPPRHAGQPHAEAIVPVETGRRAQRLHYAWIVAAVTFFVLLITAGIRATPGLLMVPLEEEFGWITVPPTVRLTGEAFGRENTGVIYGWIGASHQLGASLAAFGAGAIRTFAGDYRVAFWIAGVLCVIAGLSFLTIGRRSFAAARSTDSLATA